MLSRYHLCFKEETQRLCRAVELPCISSTHAENREPHSGIPSGEFVSFQNSNCFSHSKLPRMSQPTSPSRAKLVYQPSSVAAWRNRIWCLGIFEFHHNEVPKSFLQGGIPITGVQQFLVAGSKAQKGDPPALFSCVSFPWLGEYLSMPT